MQDLIQRIYGSITALITPFKNNGEIDFDTYKSLIERQIKAGTHGLVPVGTTGESPVLSFDEHDHIIQTAVEVTNGRVPVIAGTGANSTQEAIDITRRAEKMGADVALIVAPYYNKPNQEALFQHYKAIHDAVSMPILLYNVPGRTASDLKPQTVGRLSGLERIIGIKDATGEIERFSEHRALCPKDFILLSGEDGSALAAASHGAHGCISVTANVVPELCASFQNHLRNKDFSQALEIQDKLYPLHQALFIESNPAPTKFALSQMGLCENILRLPLISVAQDTEKSVTQALNALR